MKFAGRLGNIGGLTVESEAERHDRQVRAARVEALRKTSWTELSEAELVPRGPIGWLVHEPSDKIFVLKRGAVFAAGRAVVEFASATDEMIAFFVTLDQQVVVLERLRYPSSWTEHVERREQRARKSTAA